MKVDISPTQGQACFIEAKDFRDFRQELLNSETPLVADTDKGILHSIDAFSHDELSKPLRGLSNLRCADEVGIVVEMLKYNSPKFRNELLGISNGSLHSGEFDESWRTTVFQMIPKDCDVSNVTNWRPIAISSIIYKTFSRMVYNRSSPQLFRMQPRDQHDFTPSISIEEVLTRAESFSKIHIE